MHLIDMTHNILGSSAIVGSTIPIAAGYALAMKREGKRRVVASFFGDGATEEGAFSETLNFSSLRGLPVLFVCENNGLAIHTPRHRRWATEQLCERVRTYGIETVRITDGDVLAIREAAARAVDYIRRESKPFFMECMTYRWKEHVGPGEDYDSGYRDRSHQKPWLESDQVPLIGARLPAADRRKIEDDVEQRIAKAIDFAETSPQPALKEVMSHVYAG
jgi:pyruvate dehydrogenase E1 component alpha subunit